MANFPMVGVEEIGHSGPILDLTIQSGAGTFAGFAAHGLIDTGSSVVCISTRIARQLGLRQIDRDDDLHVVGGGSVVADIYIAVIKIDLLSFEEPVQVYAVQMPRGSHDVLLGRSFLRNFMVTFDGPNERFHFARAASALYEELDG
jgi:predicted aspartyl protease